MLFFKKDKGGVSWEECGYAGQLHLYAVGDDGLLVRIGSY